MKSLTTAVVLAVAMVGVSIAGFAARPERRAASAAPAFQLEQIVPRQFGDWREIKLGGAQVVNPQAQQLLDKIYSQMLARAYVNSQGYVVMLSLAYGDDQRGSLQAHMPEVCYPAQGFTLQGSRADTVHTPQGDIAAKRLETSLGARKEPITYWFSLGATPVESRLQRRLQEIRLGLTGQVPDGLLFRVSSIDGEPERAYRMQDAFVGALLGAVGEQDRVRLAGLRSSKNPGCGG